MYNFKSINKFMKLNMVLINLIINLKNEMEKKYIYIILFIYF
jgi:hypothetical protein